jgi:hypothetical protein
VLGGGGRSKECRASAATRGKKTRQKPERPTYMYLKAPTHLVFLGYLSAFFIKFSGASEQVEFKITTKNMSNKSMSKTFYKTNRGIPMSFFL